MEDLRIAFKLFFNESQNSLFPVFISIVDIPLFTEANYTDITWSRDNVSVGFIILYCEFFLHKVLSDQGFGISNLLTFVFTNNHLSFVESFFVALLFSQSEGFFVILTFNLHFLAYSKSSQVSVCRNINNFDRVKSDHIFGDMILLSQGFLISQIRNSHPIVRGVTGNTSNNTCTLFHADCHHGDCVDSFVDGKRSFQRKSHYFLTQKFINYLYYFLLFS